MIEEYLKSINKDEKSELLCELRDYAKINNVPIITSEGINLINQIIKIKKAKKILEIGTAIGYSSINIAQNNDCFITTIERDNLMYEKALINIKRAELEKKIKVIHDDALNIKVDDLEKVDIIFIDAAKAQYIKFFEKYEVLLNDGGLIITDNLLFHGLVVEKIRDRNLKQLIKKIKRYNEWVINNPKYDTYIYSLGDGMAISVKK